jgi:hypothetical protein
MDIAAHVCGCFGRLSTGIRWTARIREQIEKEPAERGANSILQPEGELSSTHIYNNGKPLTLEVVKEVESGDVLIFAFGRICYVDENSHWTKFCVFFDSKLKRYSDYNEYNDAGDGQFP